jgi:hypothetical protein
MKSMRSHLRNFLLGLVGLLLLATAAYPIGLPFRPGQATAVATATATVTIGGTTFVSGDTVAVTFTNTGIPGFPITVTYTLGGGESVTTIATGLKNLINGSAPLAAAGITALSSAGVITVSQTSAVTTATTISSGGVTGTGNETVTLSPVSGILAAVTGAATMNQDAGTITSDYLTVAAGATYTLTVGCDSVTSNSVVQVTMSFGTNTTGDPTLNTVAVGQTPGQASFVIVVTNRHASVALNGTLKFAFVVFN